MVATTVESLKPLDGVDLESFSQIFKSKRGEVIKFKKNSKEPLNKITKEPYIGCGLVGRDLTMNVLPPLFYNTKIDPPKPVNLVGPSGTGKTSIMKCLIQNFANASDDAIRSGDDDRIVNEKFRQPLRVQMVGNMLKEELLGEWNSIRMLHAEPGEDVFTKKFFEVRNVSEALDTNRGLYFDEMTRAPEDVLNTILQPLRERMVTTEGFCFGECERGEIKDRVLFGATSNERDVGTIEPPSAIQTRFSRIVVDFIAPEDEENLIKSILSEKTEDQAQIEFIASKFDGVACLTKVFRGKGETEKGEPSIPLTVAPSIRDGEDLAKMYFEMGATRELLKDKKEGRKLKNDLAKVALSVLGKNPEDATRVSDALRRGLCGIKLTA